MPKLTQAKLREMGIVNAYDIARLGPEPQIYIDYETAHHGYFYQAAGWDVISLEPTRHLYTTQHFDLGSDTRADALSRAQAWASERYGIAEWERSAFGSFHPAGTIAAAVAAAQAQEGATT